MAMYKGGTGTRGWRHQETCVGTWVLGTRDEGLEDTKYGTRGRVGQGCGDVKNREWTQGRRDVRNYCKSRR